MTTLPISQSYALLYLRRGGPDSLYNKLTDAMSAMGISFAASDFDHLRSLNYVRKDGRGHHSLTPAGLWKVQMLARELAPQYQIHHVTFREPGKGSTLGPSASCSCMGWSIIASKRNENSIHRYAYQHLAQVAAGSWKKPRSVDAIFAEFFGDKNSGLAAGGPDPGVAAFRVPPDATPGTDSQIGE